MLGQSGGLNPSDPISRSHEPALPERPDKDPSAESRGSRSITVWNAFPVPGIR